jgi:hypothetical protein
MNFTVNESWLYFIMLYDAQSERQIDRQRKRKERDRGREREREQMSERQNH